MCSNARRTTIFICPLAFALFVGPCLGAAAEPRESNARGPADNPAAMFARDRLIAWCIVPFDAKKRGPEERAAMLEELGIKHFAYDWRAEQVPTFEAELAALKRHGLALDAFWFPTTLNDQACQILDLLARHKLKPQLWVSGGGAPTQNAAEQQARIAAEVARVRPIAEAAARIGCTIGLYGHGGWFGEPENQLAVLAELKLPNVGLVYNLHHGHAHVDRFAELLEKMKPHLLCVNLNGMDREGNKHGNKIMPLGQGELDLQLLRTLVASGYQGPIGVLGHTMDDARLRLLDNLDGLDWLVKQLKGHPAGARPQPRTWKRSSSGSAATGKAKTWIIEPRDEYRQRPLTVACKVRLEPRATFNIIAAYETKASGAHWELFTMPGSGFLCAYLPGMRPDHIRSTVNVCDRQPHDVALVLEANEARLLVDDRVVAEEKIAGYGRASVRGPLAVARLVEGSLDCTGEISELLLVRGVMGDHGWKAFPAQPPRPAEVLGHWLFADAKGDQANDRSTLKNPAHATVGYAQNTPMPPPGMHLASSDTRLRMTLIDRSPDQAYMALKTDGSGRLFVGGRESLFVFEPNGKGGFLPRQTLLRFGDDSIIIGLELRGDDLYVMTAAALYIVREGRTRRSGLKAEKLLWGLPLDLHVSFHCLAWGPEGDLYLNHGDPFLSYVDWQRPGNWGHWTLFAGRENKPFVYNGAGAVLRMRPDGERLQVVAGGLRGPVGLAFDDHWNLFTNDNDHEGRPDQFAPCRLLHVVPHVDFGWPRGWMASKSPDRFDLIEPMSPDLGRGVPCDLLYFDEPTWPAEYRQRLLMCRWDRGTVAAYSLIPRGASFSTTEQVLFQGNNDARPVGIGVDTQGRMFVSSLYMPGNAASPHCASDIVMITPSGPARISNSCELGASATAGISKDVSELRGDALWPELAQQSWERRRRAFQEILRRGGKLLDEAARRFCSTKAADAELIDVAWLAAPTARGDVVKRLREMAVSSDSECSTQALRIFTEYRTLEPEINVILDSLGELTKRGAATRLAALEFFFAEEVPLPFAKVLAAISPDSYLRQIAIRLLSERALAADLTRIAKSRNADERAVAVMAIGVRLTTPARDEQPPAGIDLFYPKDNAFFRTKIQYTGSGKPIDLRDSARIGGFTAAQRWKARSPSIDCELFNMLNAALDDRDDNVALHAVYYLHLLNDPRSESRLAGAVRRVWKRRLSGYQPIAVKKLWLLGPLPKDAAQALKLDTGTIDLAALYKTPSGPQRWHVAETANQNQIVLEAESDLPSRAFAYFTLQSRNRQMAIVNIGWPKPLHVRVGGRVAEAWKPEVLRSEALVELQAGSNDVVVELNEVPAYRTPFTISCVAATGVSAELPEQITGALLAQRLRDAIAAGSAPIPRELVEADWPAELARADRPNGRKLFATLGCVKCHAIGPEQAGGGAPSLAEAKLRFTLPHVVESILLPSKQVAEPFRASTLVLADGRVLTGLIAAESADKLELLQPDASKVVVPAKDIDQRSRGNLSPMPQGLVKTVAELRDLLGYIMSDRPLPP